MPRPLVHYTTSTPPSPFTGTAPVPADRSSIGELTAVRDAVRAGSSAWTGSGLTRAAATGEARDRRDRRIAARTAAAVVPAPRPAPTPHTPPPRPVALRLTPTRIAPLPTRPGLVPVFRAA